MIVETCGLCTCYFIFRIKCRAVYEEIMSRREMIVETVLCSLIHAQIEEWTHSTEQQKRTKKNTEESDQSHVY